MRVFDGVAELRDAVGTRVGESDWVTIDQSQVDMFADATDDHQWIHIDQERAKAGPFGTTIAHGFLTLSLLSSLLAKVYRIDNVRMGINYGLNKVRFPAPVPVGSRIRLTATLVGVEEFKGGLQLVVGGVIEREGGDKPVCVLESVTRLYG